MNINSIDSQYLLNQGYVPFGNSPVPTTGKDGGAFAEMLEKAAEAAQDNHNPTPILKGGKADIDKTSKLFEMCQELETFLLKNLINSMRDTVQKSDLLDTGFAGKFYEDMLYDEYAKGFAKNAGLGFAELAYIELSGQRGKAISQHF
jgi:flagellar protein FlgJ